MRKFLPWLIGETAGWVRRDVAARLGKYPTVFRLRRQDGAGCAIIWRASRSPFRRGRRRRARPLTRRRVRGLAQRMVPGADALRRTPLMRLERAALPMFGVHGYGVHMNGYRARRRPVDWIGKRADNRPIEPSKLDHLVAGGIPLRPKRDGMPDQGMRGGGLDPATPPRGPLPPPSAIAWSTRAGCATIRMFRLRPGAAGRFQAGQHDGADRELPPDGGGEVEEILAAGEDFKFNVALVLIDFLIPRPHPAGASRLQRSRPRPLAARLWQAVRELGTEWSLVFHSSCVGRLW
jgi:hypothetical protein